MEPERPAHDPPAKPQRPAIRPASAAGKATWFLRRAIGSLPEAEQFESVQQRDEAIGEINQEVSRLRSLDLWTGSGILIVVGLAAWYVFKTLLLLVNWHPLVEKLALWGSVTAVYGVTSWFLWRWGSREGLREKLIGRGIPVCRGCGYSLRGQTAKSKACPECGRAIDEDVARILTAYRGS
jgi:hypothetical protein